MWIITIILLTMITSINFSIILKPVQTDEPSGQIAYEKSSVKNGNIQTDICIMTIETLSENCVTNTSNYSEYDPIWSPDGGVLAYGVSKLPLGGGSSITYLYNIAQQTFQTLPPNWYIGSWSPDGNHVVTSAFLKQFGYSDIIIVNLVDNQVEQLTHTEDTELHPIWSPDDKQLVYISGYPFGTLMSMSIHGDNQHALTSDLNVSGTPEWSPDGKQIAFVVNGDYVGQDQTSEIYTINADGSDLRQVTQMGGVILDPKWSPDGKQLVFYESELGAFDSGSKGGLLNEVFRINSDGSDLVDLTQNAGLDIEPSWSPDGKWITFASTRKWESENARSGIFIMRADGRDVQMITHEPPVMAGGSSFTNPVWRPEPTVIQAEH